MALLKVSREQGFKISHGGRRRKSKFVAINLVRLICMKSAKRTLVKSSGSCPSYRRRRCSKLTNCPWTVMVYTDNIQNPYGSEEK